jgi:hypothetical protein
MTPIRMLCILAVAVPLAAQQPDSAAHHGMHMGRGMGMEKGGMEMRGGGREGMMGPMGHMSDPMMTRIMVFSPNHLLMHRAVLALTDQQVAKLTALRDGAKAAGDAAHADMETHGHALATVFSTPAPDTAQLKAHFHEMQAAMAKAHWTALSAAAQARAVLTDTQRARADGWADAMEHMGPMMEHGGHDMEHDRHDHDGDHDHDRDHDSTNQ